MSQILVGTAANDGTGDPIRTAFQKVNASMRDCMNVLSFGAKGDGVTNDYTAIQAARTAATAGSLDYPVYFPPGIYNCTPALTMIAGHENILIGSGRECSILRAPAATPGPIINWVGNTGHPNTEFGCSLQDMSFDSNGASTGVTIIVSSLTLFRMDRCFVNNGFAAGYGALNTCSGMNLISLYDSEFHDVYVSNCGGGSNQGVLMDCLSSPAAQSMNNCVFVNFHVELGAVDAILLDIQGNTTNPFTDNRFYGLKIHGDPATQNPATHAVLNLGPFAQGNRFFGGIVAYGKSTAQLVTAGQRNQFIGFEFGVGGTTPTYGIQCTSGANTEDFVGPNFKNSSTYGTACFRAESGAVHCHLLHPQMSGGTLLSDAGRSIATYDDVNTNTGTISYAADGLATIFPGFTQTSEFISTLTDAATVAVNAQAGNAFSLLTTAGVGATRAIGLPSNPINGQTIKFVIIQDATGGRAVTWNAGFKQVWSDTGNTANKRSTIMFQYNGSNWVQMGAQSPYMT